MLPEKPDEKAVEKPDTQPKTEDPKAAPQAAGPKDDKAAGERKEPTTLELVKANRERQSRAKDAAADKDSSGSKPKEPVKAQTGAESDEAGEESDLEDDEKDESGDAVDLSKIDTKAPGWFDRLTKEQRVALDKKYPGIATLVNAGKAEAQRYVEAAKKKVANQPGEQKKPQSAEPEDTDLSEAIDLLYDPKTRKQGLTKLLANEDSKGIIREVFSEYAREEFGYQPELKPVAEGFALASKHYPQLNDDDDFFNDVDDYLKQDMEAYEEMMESDKPRLIAAAIKDAAAFVTRSRAAKKKDVAPEKKAAVGPKERREKLERDTQSAKEQAGVKTGERPTQSKAESGSTADLVRSLREQRNYTHLTGR